MPCCNSLSARPHERTASIGWMMDGSPLGQHDPAPADDRAGGTAAELPAVERGVARLAAESGGARSSPRRRGRRAVTSAGLPVLQRAAGEAQDARRAGGEQLDQPRQGDDAGVDEAVEAEARGWSPGPGCRTGRGRTPRPSRPRWCGAWSLAMQSTVPSARPSTSAARSRSERSGGFILVWVEKPLFATSSSVRIRWCGATSQVTRRPRDRAQPHQVEARARSTDGPRDSGRPCPR